MASVQQTIKTSMWNYPSLFQHRSQVLAYLICHYGTGYEWHNGELVCPFPNDHADPDTGLVDYLHEAVPQQRLDKFIQEREEEAAREKQYEQQDPVGYAARKAANKAETEELFQRLFPRLPQQNTAPPLSAAEKAAAEAKHQERVQQDMLELYEQEAEQTLFIRDNIDQLIVDQRPLQHLPSMSQYSPLAHLPDDITEDWLDAAEEITQLVLACETELGDGEHRNRDEAHEIARQALVRIDTLRQRTTVR